MTLCGNIYGIKGPQIKKGGFSFMLEVANTGMRKGDLLGLTWQQVDFERGLMFVANKKAGDGRGHFLPMNSQVLRELVRLRAERTGERVFDVKDVKKAFATACRIAGIINLRFHDLRHTAATRSAEAGADAFTIAAASP